MSKEFALPMSVEELIPHRPPMRLVDTLLSWDGTMGEVESIPAADSLLAGSDGVDAAAFLEMLAQAYAAVKGYGDLSKRSGVSEGFLVAVRRFRVTGVARAGDRLLVRIRTVGSFDGFFVAEGEVERDGEPLATATLNLYGRRGTAGGVAP